MLSLYDFDLFSCARDKQVSFFWCYASIYIEKQIVNNTLIKKNVFLFSPFTRENSRDIEPRIDREDISNDHHQLVLLLLLLLLLLYTNRFGVLIASCQLLMLCMWMRCEMKWMIDRFNLIFCWNIHSRKE